MVWVGGCKVVVCTVAVCKLNLSLAGITGGGVGGMVL